ncbi:MAG: ABC transporter permease [Actinobacteria bacterium]|nr:ABC transporter permease [Actinomycetota bacterium]
MRLSSLLHLYRVRLRARAMQELLAVAGIAVGVGLMFAALVANTSLLGAQRELDVGTQGKARLLVVARGPEGLDERLVPAVRRIDGVAAVSTMLIVPATVAGPTGERSVFLVSGDMRLARNAGVMVRRFTRQVGGTRVVGAHALAMTAPLADALHLDLGSVVRLQAAGHSVDIPLGAELRRSDYGKLVDSPFVLAPPPLAQRVSDMRGRMSRIVVSVRPGRETAVRRALRALAPDANVERADSDAAAFERAAVPITRTTAVFSVFAAFVGFLFAFTAVLLTVPQRRRFIADLRMAGHEPWVTLQLLLFDALVLGVAGSLLGLLSGYLAIRHLIEIVPSILTYAFPIGERVSVRWQSVVTAVAAGLLAACCAVLLPLRGALARGDATAHGRHSGFGPGGGMAALACATLAIAAWLIARAPQATTLSFSLLTASLLLLLPASLRVATGVFEALTRTLRTPVPTLASLELRSRATRTRAVALASTAAIAVYATVGLEGAHADLRRGLLAAATATDANGDVWVTFPGATNALATVPFPVPAGTLAKLRGLPDVSHVSVYRGSFLEVGIYRAWVQAPPGSARTMVAASQILHGDAAMAARRLREGGWVVLSTAIADTLRVRVGDPVTLPTPVPQRLRVAAVSTNLDWPAGAIVLNARDYARAWSRPAPSALLIEVAQGASPAGVAAAVRRALPPRMPALVETRAERIARHVAVARDALARIDQVSALVLIAALAAIVGAIGGVIWQRRPAIARLKVHGYPEHELWRALLLENALLLGTGCGVGAAFGLLGQILFTRGMQTLTDLPEVYVPAGVTAAGILLLMTGVAVAMIALPGWLAVRVRPAPGGAG